MVCSRESLEGKEMKFSSVKSPGDTPLYKPYRYVPPKGMVFEPFWSKTEGKVCALRSGNAYSS